MDNKTGTTEPATIETYRKMNRMGIDSGSQPPSSVGGGEPPLVMGGTGTRTRSGSLPGSPPSLSSKSPKSGAAAASASARKTNSLPLETVEYLKAWMMSPEHVAHPYPTEQEKAKIMADTGIELKQLTNWFVNNRKRFWKPRVEARLQEVVVSTSAPTTISPPHHPPPHLITPTVVTPLKKVDSTSGFVPLSDLTLQSASLVSGYRHLLEPQTSSSHRVNKLTPSSSSSSLNSSPARVSDQSETDSVCSSTDNDADGECHHDNNREPPAATSKAEFTASAAEDLLTQTEHVNVHILRPTDGNPIPTLDHVVVLHNVPADRVLKSFLNCPLTYSVPAQDLSNSFKIQSCRDAELVKLRAWHLRQFLTAPLSPSTKRPRPASEEPLSALSVDSIEPAIASPRPKFRRASLDVWREACTQSKNCYDQRLPTLEEAAALFGFATS